MPERRTTPEAAETPVRLSPTQREHELAMAYATKPVRSATSTTEVGTGTTGALSGRVYLKSHVTVREENEDWPRYIGRYESELRDILAVHARLNDEAQAAAGTDQEASK